jgi:hypothetical protein
MLDMGAKDLNMEQCESGGFMNIHININKIIIIISSSTVLVVVVQLLVDVGFL